MCDVAAYVADGEFDWQRPAGGQLIPLLERTGMDIALQVCACGCCTSFCRSAVLRRAACVLLLSFLLGSQAALAGQALGPHSVAGLYSVAGLIPVMLWLCRRRAFRIPSIPSSACSPPSLCCTSTSGAAHVLLVPLVCCSLPGKFCQ